MNEPPPDYLRSRELLSREQSRLVIVDVQEKLIPLIHKSKRMIENCRRLIEGAHILGVPVFATEQYPGGLGATVEPLAGLLPDRPEKLRFSSAEVLNWEMAATVENERDQAVVAGIEAHVCIQQTVLDLAAMGYRVFVPADAVSSRSRFDCRTALSRMADSGATVTTTESVLFEWCEVAGTEEFQRISRLITGKARD